MGNRSSLLISGTMWTTAPQSSLRDGFIARTWEPSSYRSSKSELWSTNPFLTWRHGFKFHIVDLSSGLWHPSSAKREGRIQVSFLFYNWVLRSRCQRMKYAGNSHWDSQEPAAKMFCSYSMMWETNTLFRSGEEASKLWRRFVNQQKIQVTNLWIDPVLLCGADAVFREPPFHLNTMNVMLPFSFKDWLDRQRPALAQGGPINMFGAQFETEVAQIQKYTRLICNILEKTASPSVSESEVH